MKPHPLLLPLAVFTVSMASLFPGELLANGGGYIKGGTEAVGGIEGFVPKETENIRILEEDLHVRLGPKSAKVELRYRFRNETNKRVTARFGFPVEESPTATLLNMSDRSKPPLTQTEPLYCTNFSITLRGKPLSPKWQGEKRQMEDKRFEHLAGWFVSQANFSPGEEVALSISFDSFYPSEKRSVSEDASYSAALFRYRLSTAACWAGPIGKGRIVLEPDGVDPEEVRVIKPVNRFQKVGERWIWEFNDLEPSLNDDLEIEAQPPVFTYMNHGGDFTYFKRGERWSSDHANYAITASSTLAPEEGRTYGPENLKEWGRAWAEGAPGSGVGAWLEIKPKVPKPLSAISFSPGFPEASLFKANARPKRIRVELNDEHAFSIHIPDERDAFRIPVSSYAKPVSKIRLTFEEVWPGAQYEDLCLHTLRLHVRLDRKPEFREAR